MAFGLGVALYTILGGAFQVRAGGLRLSAASWQRPLMQASWCALVAGWLFYRDWMLRGEWDRVPGAVIRFLTGSAEEVRRRLLWSALLAGAAASLLVSYRLARQSMEVGSGDAGWIYGYLFPLGPAPFAMWIVTSALVAAGLRWLPDVRRRQWPTVVAWIVLGIAIQALMRSLTPFTLEQIFLSPVANSFYTVTQEHGAASVLANFAELRESWPIHAHANMPGKLMFLYALELVSARPAVLAWLMVLVSSLGGVLMYVFVRDLFSDRRAALYALILYMLVPGKVFFFPLMNTVTPVIALAMAVLVQRWLRGGRVVYAALLGAGLFGVVFFEPVPLVLGLLFLALAARAVSRGDVTWRTLAWQCGVGLIVFVAMYAAIRAWLHFDLLDAFGRIRADAATFNERAQRVYGVWVRQNLIDVFFGVGVCQTLLVAAALADGLRGSGPRRALETPIAVLTISLTAALLVLDLSGVNRGEVLRLWIFLECLFQIPAAYVCAQLDSRVAIWVVAATTLLQIALGMTMVGFIIP